MKKSSFPLGARRAAALLFSLALAACATAARDDSSVASESVTAVDHWVQGVSALDGKPVKLYVREKLAKGADPSAMARSGKVVLLAHGSGTPSSVVFDLATGYSLMDYLASRGFDVFAVDYQNYGRS